LSKLTDASGNNLPLDNIFFAPTAMGNNAPETINQLKTTLYNTGTSELWGVDGIVRGTPYELPAGKLEFAVGGGYNYEALSLAVDGLTQQGLVPGLNQAAAFPGGVRDRYALFVEVKIPIFSDERNIPGFHSLELTAAGRHESINPGGDANVPKVGVRWQPLDEQVTLRGGYSQGFIAPAIFNLFGPDSVNNPQITLSDGTGQVNIQQRSSPDLKPSDSDQWNVGIVASPKAVKGLTVSADYYSVTQNHVAIADYTSEAASLNALGSASPFAQYFTFANGNRLTNAAPNQVMVGNWGNLIVPVTGSAAVKTDGLDFAINYSYPLPNDWGKLTLNGNANWILDYEFQASPVLPYFHYEGQGTYNFGTAQGLIPDYNVNCSLAWDYKNFTYVMSAHYIPGVKIPGSLHPSVVDPIAPDQGSTVNGLAQQLGDYYTIDMQLSYEFGKSRAIKSWHDGLRLTAGCRNITDNGAPFIAGATEDNTDKTFYDLLGRFVYFEVAKKF
jgi:iron complex outermembrane receptor protein